MIVLTGDTGKKDLIPRLKEYDIGRIFVIRAPKPYRGEKWGFDNGAYAAWTNDRKWLGSTYIHRLGRAYKTVSKPYMAMLPDKPTQPDSMHFSLTWLDHVPDDWPWYFVLQDGMDFYDVREYVCTDKRITGLFLGGTHKFKDEEGKRYVQLAKEYDKKFHYGRSSSLKLIQRAHEWGCDSCDSSYFLWQKERIDDVIALMSNGFKEVSDA